MKRAHEFDLKRRVCRTCGRGIVDLVSLSRFYARAIFCELNPYLQAVEEMAAIAEGTVNARTATDRSHGPVRQR